MSNGPNCALFLLFLFVVYLVWLVCPIAGWRTLLGWKQVGGLMLAAGQDLSSSQGWWSCQVSGEETERRKCWRFPPSYSAAHSRHRQDCSLWKEKEDILSSNHWFRICHAIGWMLTCYLGSRNVKFHQSSVLEMIFWGHPLTTKDWGLEGCGFVVKVVHWRWLCRLV